MIKKKKNNIIVLVSFGLLVMVVVLSILFMGVRLLGYNTYPVLDDEMSPAYRLGSLAYVKKIEKHDIQSGTIISYRAGEGGAISMQRVETVLDGGLRFRTNADKGSSIESKDVLLEDIIGSPDFSIPLVGYFAVLVRNKVGFIFMASFLVLPMVIFGGKLEIKFNKLGSFSY